jgi:hypothetical protein
MAWPPFLKEYAEMFLFGAIFFTVQAVRWLYRRHHLLHGVQCEGALAQQQQRKFMREGIIGLSLSFVFLVLFCLIQLSSINTMLVVYSLLAYLIGSALLSAIVIAAEKSKWCYQQ